MLNFGTVPADEERLPEFSFGLPFGRQLGGVFEENQKTANNMVCDFRIRAGSPIRVYQLR